MIRQTSRSTRADTLFPNTTLFRSAADHLQHSRRDGMFDLTGKFALVTGATGGIGNAIAEALHAQGATVALSGTREAVLQELAGKLGSRAHVVPCNPAAAEAVRSEERRVGTESVRTGRTRGA